MTALTTVADVIGHLERMAPPSLAEPWDNCGLQVGAMDWAVRRIWVALDPLPEVVAAACADGADLLVTHHPLIFKALTRVDLGTPTGRIIAQALAAGLAIYAAHTNLDSAADGLNDVLARHLGVSPRAPLAVSVGGATPSDVGLGRIGRLDRPVALGELARRVCRQLAIDQACIVGDPDRAVHHVALCSGSGGSLVGAFLAGPADVFITGEIRYHDAQDILAAGRCAIDIGHFASERIMIQDVARRLQLALGDVNINLTACTLEKDPFTRLQVLSSRTDE